MRRPPRALIRAAQRLARHLGATDPGAGALAAESPVAPGALEDAAAPSRGGTSLVDALRSAARARTFSTTAGHPAAAELAARLACSGPGAPLDPSVPPQRAGLRAAHDPALPPGRWRMRAVGGGLELAAGGDEAIAAGARYAARTFPKLPDGRRIEDLESEVEHFLALETRAGRLAAAAVAATRLGGRARRVHLPYPGAAAPLALRLPVVNSARDGTRRVWETTLPWEGDLLDEAVTELTRELAGRGGTWDLEAYASEDHATRLQLAGRLAATAAAGGLVIGMARVRNAYKPALHWLLEEIAPSLPATAAELEVLCSRQDPATGAPDRWLRELHPAIELLAQLRPRLGVRITLAEVSRDVLYHAVVRDARGNELSRETLAPPVAPSPRPGAPDALATTAAVRAVRGGPTGTRTAAERHVPTDRGALWTWFVRGPLSDMCEAADEAGPPFLHEVAVVARLSEPDDRWPLDHETDSVTEGLHEEVTFGFLEAFAARHPGVARRALAPGRILPFVHARPRRDGVARVVARAWGSERCAVEDEGGTLHELAALRPAVRAVELAGSGPVPDRVSLELAGTGAREAHERLAWSARASRWRTPGGPARADGSPLPPTLDVVLLTGTDEHVVERAAAPRPATDPPPSSPLPHRPLHPWEARARALDLARTHHDLSVRTPAESGLGLPLTVLELAPPSHDRGRRTAWLPAVLVSARQHANEPTSTHAVLGWLERLCAATGAHRRISLVAHPLENPDGARLHAALRSIAPNHMHHAARYTAFGADIGPAARVRGRSLPEHALHAEARRRWDPVVHLNNHGYPAHEWVRPETGYLPTGFEDWSLPTGQLTILQARHAESVVAREALEHLAAGVAAALAGATRLAGHTRAQVARSHRYRPAGATPFVFERGLPFWLVVRPPDEPGPNELRPMLTLITEVTDETVEGELWDWCVQAHGLVDQAMLDALVAALPDERASLERFDWLEALAAGG